MNNLSISQKLVVGITLTTTLMLMVLGIFSYQQSKELLVNEIKGEIETSGQGLSRFISNWQKDKFTVLNAAGSVINDQNEIPVLDQGLASGSFLQMYLGTRQGKMVIRPQTQLPPDYDPRQRPWYQQAMAENKPVLTPPYEDAVTGELVVTFAQPIASGVIAADLIMKEVVQGVLAVDVGSNGYAMLVDGDGKVLVHPDESLVNKSLPKEFAQGRHGNDLKESRLEGTKVLSASFPVERSDWQLMIVVEEDDVFASLNTLLFSTIILSLLTIVAVSLVASFLIRWLLSPMKKLKLTMEDIASGHGDLTSRIEFTQKDEIGSVSRSFNAFIETIHNLVTQVTQSAYEIQTLSEQSHATSNNNNLKVQQQQEEVSLVAAATQQLSSTSALVAENAEQTRMAADAAENESATSEQNAKANRNNMVNLAKEIEQTTNVITELNIKAQSITGILATIQGIAEQTNLLALNAAIEAARAGEQGRGFAVVADEVRALSQRTHEATGEIQNMIDALNVQTATAVDQMEKSQSLVTLTMNTATLVAQSQELIKKAIQDINSQAITISESSREQTQATEEISRISHVIQESTNHLAENVASANSQADQLSQLGKGVKSQLSRFRI